MNNHSAKTPSLLWKRVLKLSILTLCCLTIFIFSTFQSTRTVAATTKCGGGVGKNPTITPFVLEKFEAIVNAAMATYDVPGVAIAIVAGDKIVYAKGFGWRNLENHEPVTPDTRFPVYSMTKAMTSAMIATLVDEGKLHWNQRVVEIWPDFTLPTTELTNTVRVRHLMQMNTGLGVDFNLFYDTRLNAISAQEPLDSLVDFPIWAGLNEEFYYNDGVYASAGYMGALAAGASYGDLFNAYEELMQERIFNPIGMESAILSLDLPAIGGDYATGYAFNLVTGVFESVHNPNLTGDAPAGLASVNVTDMARFLIMQLNQGIAPNGTRVVSARHLVKTRKPNIKINDPMFYLPYPLAQANSLHYGMGWISVEQPNGVQVIGHPGGFEGFTSDMAFIPEADVGIVTLTNLNFFYGVLSSSYFIGVVRDSLFELLYDLEPTVAKQRAEQHQLAMAEAAIPRDTIQVTFDPDTVAPYLGHYEKNWQLELRSDNTLWLVLHNIYEYQLIFLPDGTYRISNNSYLGNPVSFSTSDEGIILMSITTFGTDTVAKID